MRKRTRSREFALQVLYQMDLSKKTVVSEALEHFWDSNSEEESGESLKHSLSEDKKDPDVRAYTQLLVRGVYDKLDIIDKTIEKFAENWSIGRMAYVDRNILRLAAYEILFCEDIPVKVAINEAVEIAKRFGEDDSSKFVNGILDKIAKKESTKT